MMLKSLLLSALAALVLCAAGASPAAARVLEIGEATDVPAPPSCPENCFALSRTTGYQAKIGVQRGLYTIPADGRIVAWSISLGDPDEEQRTSFEKRFGGAAAAGITILRPRKRLYARTQASGPVQRLTRYFGSTAQFPLERSIPVRKGWVIALTVPTWSPSLAVGLGGDTSWRAASRKTGKCSDLETQRPQTQIEGLARYRCLFRTARLTYSATLITTPKTTDDDAKATAAR